MIKEIIRPVLTEAERQLKIQELQKVVQCILGCEIKIIYVQNVN